MKRENKFMEENISKDKNSIGVKVKELITFNTKGISQENTFLASRIKLFASMGESGGKI